MKQLSNKRSKLQLNLSTINLANCVQCCDQGTRCRDRGQDRGSIPQDRGTRQLAYNNSVVKHTTEKD